MQRHFVTLQMIQSAHRNDFKILLDLLDEAMEIDLRHFQCFLKLLEYLVDLEIFFCVEFVKLVLSVCIVS